MPALSKPSKTVIAAVIGVVVILGGASAAVAGVLPTPTGSPDASVEATPSLTPTPTPTITETPGDDDNEVTESPEPTLAPSPAPSSGDDGKAAAKACNEHGKRVSALAHSTTLTGAAKGRAISQEAKKHDDACHGPKSDKMDKGKGHGKGHAKHGKGHGKGHDGKHPGDPTESPEPQETPDNS